MKKLLISALSVLLIIFTLSGCGGKVTNKNVAESLDLEYTDVYEAIK